MFCFDFFFKFKTQYVCRYFLLCPTKTSGTQLVHRGRTMHLNHVILTFFDYIAPYHSLSYVQIRTIEQPSTHKPYNRSITKLIKVL